MKIYSVIFILVMLSTNSAYALSGTVVGRFLFYNNQGNFCRIGENCLHAQYLENEFNVNLPVRNAKVYVQQNGIFIGAGTTDSNGYYNITWSSATTGTPANVYLSLDHADSRFKIRAPSGNPYYYVTTSQTLITNGTTDFFTVIWGSSTAPIPQINVYDGAWRTWEKALKYSGLMITYFTNITVTAFVSSSVCATGCASDTGIQLTNPSEDAYKPQTRIMHEMGHVAGFKASKDQYYTPYINYCWPSLSSTGCTWTYFTSEWGSSQFEEGFASFIADTTLYWYANPRPLLCGQPAMGCNSYTSPILNLETSTMTGNCLDVENFQENRWPISVEKFLRDLYDTTNDGGWDTASEGFGWFLTAINSFPNGQGEGQKEEPFTTGFIAPGVDDRDGRSSVDFLYIWDDLHTNGTGEFNSFYNNCLLGVGD